MKTYLQLTVTQTTRRFNRIMTLNVHKDLTEKLRLSKIGKQFASSSQHRLTLFGKFLASYLFFFITSFKILILHVMKVFDNACFLCYKYLHNNLKYGKDCKVFPVLFLQYNPGLEITFTIFITLTI